MLKNVLILCISIIFSVSISAADLNADQEAKPSQVSVEMESITCEDVDTITTDGLSNLAPVELMGDDEARACCKICTKGKACGNSCIAKSKTCHKGKGCACNG